MVQRARTSENQKSENKKTFSPRERFLGRAKTGVSTELPSQSEKHKSTVSCCQHRYFHARTTPSITETRSVESGNAFERRAVMCDADSSPLLRSRDDCNKESKPAVSTEYMSRIPLRPLNVNSGHIADLSFRSALDGAYVITDDSSLSLEKMTPQSDVPTFLPSAGSDSYRNEAADITPLPLLRREVSADLAVIRGSRNYRSGDVSDSSAARAARSETSLIFSPGGIVGPCSRPTTSASTTASLPDRVTLHESMSFLVTPSTRDTAKTSSGEASTMRANENYVPIRSTQSFFSRRSGTIFLLLFCIPICFCYFALYIFDEFASGRCWSSVSPSSKMFQEFPSFDSRAPFVGGCVRQFSPMDSLTDSLTPRQERHAFPSTRVICTGDSVLRWIPNFIQRYLRIEVLGFQPRISTPERGWSIQYVGNQFREFYRQLSIPQRLARYLRRIADHMHSTSQTDSIPASPQTASILNALQQQVTQFEMSGIIETEMQNSIGSRALRKHNEEFKQRIEHVNDNLFVAIGYGLANVVIIDTPEGQ